MCKRVYSVLGKLSRIEVVNGEVDYRLMSRKMVDSVLALSERNRFTKGYSAGLAIKQNGCRMKMLNVRIGTSKWSFLSSLRYSLEGVFGFSTSFFLFKFLGGLFCIVAFLLFLVYNNQGICM